MESKESKIGPISAPLMIIWVLYLIWSAITGQGLCGYVQSLQFSLMGAAYPKLTIIVSFLPGILLLPVGFKLDSLVSKRFHLSQNLGLALFFLSIPVVGFFGWQHLETRDSVEKTLDLQTVKLETGPSIALARPGGLNLIRLEGAYLVDATYSVESDRGGTTTLYCPLVATDFEGGEVQFVFADTVGSLNLPAVGQFIHLNRAQGLVPVTFEGVAKSGALPVYVRQEWEKNGLELSDDLYLLDFRRLVDGRIVSQPEIPYIWAFYGSLIFTMVMIGAVGLGKLFRRN